MKKVKRDKNGKFVKGSGSHWAGKKLPKATRKKLSKAHKKLYVEGKNVPPLQTGKIPWNKDKPWSDKAKKKMSTSMVGRYKGEKHWNWLGGISNNPYPSEFNPALKLKIRKRDNFTCCLCGRTEREELEELNRVLSVNHKDFDKNNCKESNLNTLCTRCNVKINRDREYWTDYFNKLCA